MTGSSPPRHDRSVERWIACARLGLSVGAARGLGGTATAVLVACAADAGAWDETLLLLAIASGALVATLAVAVHAVTVRTADPP